MKIIVFFHLPLYILRYCKVGDGPNRREQTVVLLELFLYTDWNFNSNSRSDYDNENYE